MPPIAAPRTTGPTSSTAEAAPYGEGDPALRRVRAALFCAGVVTFASLYSTQALLPLLARSFALSAGSAAWSVSLATAGIAVGLVIAGPLSERVGRTVVMHGSLLAAAVLAIACALAPTWPVLLAVRAAEGVALAGLPAVAASYLREEVDGRAYARIMGLYVAGNAIGGMSGRLVTASLAAVCGWRGALGGIAVLAVLGMIATRILLPPSRRFAPAAVTARDLARAWGRIVTDPVLLALFGIGGTLMGAFVAVYNVIGFRLEAAPYHLPIWLAGLVFTVYAFGSWGSSTGGRWAARVGQRPVVPAGALIMLCGIAITLAGPLPLLITGLATMTFGFFVAHGVASGWVAVRAYRHGATAPATCLYLLCYYGGSSLTGATAGAVWSALRWPGVATMTSALVLAGLLLALLIRRSPRLLPPQGAPV